ncbi:putative PAP-specific phosphatase, mitochondrial-like, partial [Capsicum annuum]
TSNPGFASGLGTVLDPIDGTRGFVKGVEALYVVALALVVEGQIVLRVMGCPNWDEDYFVNCVTGVQETGNNFSRSGMIMVSHVGCGTWKQRASVFLLRATTRNVMKKISGYAPAWDHAVGIICVHDAGGKAENNKRKSLHISA